MVRNKLAVLGERLRRLKRLQAEGKNVQRAIDRTWKAIEIVIEEGEDEDEA